MQSILDNTKLTDDEVEKVGNLVADDEWMGLGMELSEIVRCAVIEEAKKNTAEFTGSDDYKVGDITKEIDVRVKVSFVSKCLYSYDCKSQMLIISVRYAILGYHGRMKLQRLEARTNTNLVT